MSQSHELADLFTAVRAEARLGASPETFRRYEELWRRARAAGDSNLATRVLEDLALLTAQLDPATGRQLAEAAQRSAAVRSEVELSVIVLGLPEPATNAPLLVSLAKQTVTADRYETLLAARTDATACNEALAAARGRVLLFVAPDVSLAPDALARHLAAHSPDATAQIVLGAVHQEGLGLRPLAWALERLSLTGCQDSAGSAGEVPAECLDLRHASVRRDVLARSGGFDSSMTYFLGGELATRLAAAGVPCVLSPEIVATQPAAADLAGWLGRMRRMGADWLRLRRRHGASASPSWLRGIGLEEERGEELLARLLADADLQRRNTESLEESLREIESVLVRDAARAPEQLAKIEPDLLTLLLDVTRGELMRGFVHALQGGETAELERCLATSRGAAVLVVSGDSTVPAVQLALSQLPVWGELIVVQHDGTASRALPSDHRILHAKLPLGAPAATLKRSLLAATGADFFVLLDGSCVPTTSEWEALRLTLGALPAIGACSVDTGNGVLASATLCATIPTALIAVRRDVLERDGSEAGTFLERVVKRGFKLAAVLARQTT